MRYASNRGASRIFSISPASDGDPLSSASTTRIQPDDARSIAKLRCNPIVTNGFARTRAPAPSAIDRVSSVDPSSTTRISRAHRTLSMHAPMFPASFRAAMTTVRARLTFSRPTGRPECHLSLRSPEIRAQRGTWPPFPSPVSAPRSPGAIRRSPLSSMHPRPVREFR